MHDVERSCTSCCSESATPKCLNISLGNICWNLQKELDENMREQLESSVTNSTFRRLYQRSTGISFTVECSESIYGRSTVS